MPAISNISSGSPAPTPSYMSGTFTGLGVVYTASTSYTTLLSVASGSGNLLAIESMCNAASVTDGDYRITIDGGTPVVVNLRNFWQTGGSANATTSSNVLPLPIAFDTSLLVEHKLSAGIQTLMSQIQYLLD